MAGEALLEGGRKASLKPPKMLRLSPSASEVDELEAVRRERPLMS